ncbi:MAG: hypothetical protein Q8L81_09020 [Bacteroidota bacterium]|nr:hypothetical protein [Bacteroidota bacterium]
MKKTILIALLGLLIVTGAKGQDNVILASYLKTIYQAGEDGSYVQVDFKESDGKITSFVEGAEIFMADAVKKSSFIGKGSSFGDVTNKSNVGKKYMVTYFTDEAGSKIIKAAKDQSPQQTQNPMDTVLPRLKKIQAGLLTQNKCPNCPIDGAKEFMKKQIAEIDKQLQTQTKPKVQKELSDTKEFLQASLNENKFLTYFFSNNRASVLINKKFANRYFAIQLKKQDKWIGIGIDDSWSSCKELKVADEVKTADALNCGVYFDNALKNQ